MMQLLGMIAFGWSGVEWSGVRLVEWMQKNMLGRIDYF
jgi:hypothetical protein